MGFEVGDVEAAVQVGLQHLGLGMVKPLGFAAQKPRGHVELTPFAQLNYAQRRPRLLHAKTCLHWFRKALQIPHLGQHPHSLHQETSPLG
jgi:hypothetical protein